MTSTTSDEIDAMKRPQRADPDIADMTPRRWAFVAACGLVLSAYYFIHKIAEWTG